MAHCLERPPFPACQLPSIPACHAPSPLPAKNTHFHSLNIAPFLTLTTCPYCTPLRLTSCRHHRTSEDDNMRGILPLTALLGLESTTGKYRRGRETSLLPSVSAVPPAHAPHYVGRGAAPLLATLLLAAHAHSLDSGLGREFF